MRAKNRIIGQHIGPEEGPVLVFFGGIHGNEPAGVIALQNFMGEFDKIKLNGSVYAIKGNLEALAANKRYLAQDLNRMWTEENIKSIQNKSEPKSEEKELLTILNLIQVVLNKHSGPFYFFDLHTTSSKSVPFITINDAIINRSFSKLFPVPIVLGIEEYLEGPLLSYINQLGYVSLGFESGQHDDPKSIENNKAFITIALVQTGCINSNEIGNYNNYLSLLKEQSKSLASFFEIVYLYQLKGKNKFKMNPGFDSFQRINKGLELARDGDKTIISNYKGRMFMPLYQKIGSEGFFIIKPIHLIFLGLSKLLRNLKSDQLLVWLPGVKWQNKEKGILSVNLKIARFLAKPLFHILGYRNKQITRTHLYLYNRERVAKSEMYKGALWH